MRFILYNKKNYLVKIFFSGFTGISFLSTSGFTGVVEQLEDAPGTSFVLTLQPPPADIGDDL